MNTKLGKGEESYRPAQGSEFPTRAARAGGMSTAPRTSSLGPDEKRESHSSETCCQMQTSQPDSAHPGLQRPTPVPTVDTFLSHIRKQTQLSFALKWVVVRFGCYSKSYGMKRFFLANFFLFIHIIERERSPNGAIEMLTYV